MNILFQIPVWVWPLFVGLLIVGFRSTHARRAPVWVFYLLPLLAFILIVRVWSMAQTHPLGGWLYGIMLLFLGMGIVLGFRLQPRWIEGRSAHHVHLRGEWVTLMTVMGIFGLNFIMGMIGGVAPDMLQGVTVPVVYIGIVGVLSASLTGRALAVAKAPISDDF